MRNTIYTMLSALILIGCSSNNDFEKGRKQLIQQEYTNIKNTGHSWFCCDDKDSFSTGFTAVDKKGETVEGCICSGVLKGVTIRFE